MPEKPSTPLQRLRNQIGAEALHSKYDSRELTKKAREALRERFLREVDPDGVLPQDERERRAEHARRAHYKRLALLSLRNRQARAKQKQNGRPVKPTEPAA